MHCILRWGGRGEPMRWTLSATVGLGLALCVLLIAGREGTGAGAEPRNYVELDQAGRLVYATDGRGNRIPDFSRCGYMGGGVAIPDVPVKIVVSPAEGDNGPKIQAAIDLVGASLPTHAASAGRSCSWPVATRSAEASASRQEVSSFAARETVRAGRYWWPRGPTDAP